MLSTVSALAGFMHVECCKQARTCCCCRAKSLCLTAAVSVLDLFLFTLLLLLARSCQVAMLIHSAVTCCCAPLTGADLGAVAEGLKVLLLLSTCAATKGEAAQVCSTRFLLGCVVLYSLHSNMLVGVRLIIRFCLCVVSRSNS